MSWTMIESQTLGASTASVTLGSGGTIPQTYKTLLLVASARTDGAVVWDTVKINPNNATTSLTDRYVYGTGTTTGATTDVVGLMTFAATGANATASTFGNGLTVFPNYAGSTNKPISSDGVSETNATGATQALTASLWSSTAAITSIVLKPFTGTNFVSGSTFTLYGLK